ncbi:MAG: DUF2971 domain-containing protein [Bacteroidota bacterium]
MLTNAELWFASALSFNDPFDTSFTYDFDGIEGSLGRQWAESAVRKFNPTLSPLHQERFAAFRLAELRDRQLIEQQRARLIEDNYKIFGICSLAGSHDNLLMWAHYAGQHSGFVVEVSVKHIYQVAENLVRTNKELVDLLEVEYSEVFPRANFFETMLHSTAPNYPRQFIAVKSNHWKYEEEHRLILWNYTNRALSFGHSAFNKIFLGCRIADTNKAIIIDIVQKYFPNVEIWQAKKSDTKFALQFDLITKCGA